MIATALLKGGFCNCNGFVYKAQNSIEIYKMIRGFNILSIFSMWYYIFLICNVSRCINLKC